MHDIVTNELEEYLAGTASPAFHQHLGECAQCRGEIEAIAEMSVALSELRISEETLPEPPPFFYTRVAAGITEKESELGWQLMSPGAAFFRRIAFASLLVLAGLGTYLVTRENDVAGTDAATIMAQHDVTTAHSEATDRDLMLVTLASYRE